MKLGRQDLLLRAQDRVTKLIDTVWRDLGKRSVVILIYGLCTASVRRAYFLKLNLFSKG